MSTTNISSWAVDLADISYIFPFQGTEGILAVAGIAAWLLWHVWQVRHESAKYELVVRDHWTAENEKNAMNE